MPKGGKNTTFNPWNKHSSSLPNGIHWAESLSDGCTMLGGLSWFMGSILAEFADFMPCILAKITRFMPCILDKSRGKQYNKDVLIVCKYCRCMR